MKTTNKLLPLTTFVAAAMSFCAVPAWADDYTWTGTGNDDDWATSGNWGADEWVNGSDSDAYFPYDETGSTKNVTISGEIIAGAVTIAGDGYVFTVTEDGSLSMTELVPDGTYDPHLTIAGSGTVTIGDSSSGYFVLKGLLTISESVTVIFPNIEFEGGTLEVTGGYVSVSNHDGNAQATNGSTIKVSGGTLQIDMLDVLDGASLEITNGEVNIPGFYYSSDSVGISSGGKVKISGGKTTIQGIFFYEDGELEVTGGTFVVGELYMTEDAVVTLSGGDIQIGDGGITLLGGVGDDWGTSSHNTTLVLGVSITTSGAVKFTEAIRTIEDGSEVQDFVHLVLSDTLLATYANQGPVTIIEASSISYNGVDLSSCLDDFISVVVSYDTEGYTLSDWTYADGKLSVTITATSTPEPELFSIFFGLGAIGLVATRRRRRRAV